MPALNPYYPDTLGIEWAPTIEAATVIDGPAKAAGATLTAQATEDIEAISVFLPDLTRNVGDSGFEVEVYDRANLGSHGLSAAAFVPGSDASNFGTYAFGGFAPAGTNVDTYRGIDSYPAALFSGKGTWPNSGQPIDNDELTFGLFGAAHESSYRFAGIAGTTGTKRITKVTLRARVQMYVFEADRSGLNITPFLLINGVHYWGPASASSGEYPGGRLVEASWTANPESGCSWKASDLDDFDTGGGASSAGWQVASTGSANKLASILQGWIEVEYTDDAVDPRVAVGCVHPTARGWVHIDLVNPTTGAPWAKAAGSDYLIVLRRRTGSGSVAWRYLAAEFVPPGPGSVAVAYAPIAQILAAVGDDPLPRTYAWALHIDGSGAVSADSSPYASIDGDIEPTLGIDSPWTLVHAGSSVTQEFTVPGAGPYGWARAVVRQETATVDGDLTLTLLDPVGTPVGAPIVVTSDDLDPTRPRTVWQIIEGSFGSNALTPADQYRIEATSPATSGTGWAVQVLSTYLVGGLTNPPSDIGDATWDGSTDAARITAVRHDELDAAITLATFPDPPADLVADLTIFDDCREWVTLTWDPTAVADGGGFLRYEIDRSDDALTWARIAYIGDESETTFDDHEARRERANYYRIRVRRVDHAASDWASAPDAAIPEMACCGYIITSNVDPEIEVWADDIGPGRTTKPLNKVTYRRFAGRKYQIGFHSLEFAGVSFARRLLLAALGGHGGTVETTTPGQRTFDPILDLMPSRGAAVPYLCVLSSDGDRWFASMEVGDLVSEGAGGGYIADVTFTEVTDIPAAVLVDLDVIS